MGSKIRNPVARSPLLRKGSAHGKTKSSKRIKAKQKLRSELAEAETEQPQHHD